MALPWEGVPLPLIHDEYVHLLVADTLAEGRLANPEHPMARHLETIYVLQHPAYAGKYPIGIGLFLALGQWLGHPWIGMLIASGLACAAIYWCLLAVLPAPWAMVGCWIAAARYLAFSYWLNSYFGGAPAALAGALLVGGLLHWSRRPAIGPGVLAAVGAGLLWIVRPYESAVMVLMVLAALWFWNRKAGRLGAGIWVKRLLLPAVAVGLVTLALTLAHNRAVTGKPLLLPYQYAQQVLGVPQSLVIQKPLPQPPLEFKDQRDIYQLQLRLRRGASSWPIAPVHWLQIGLVSSVFFLSIGGGVLVLVELKRGSHALTRPAVLACACAIGCACLHCACMPHYLAGYGVIFAFLFSQSLRGAWNGLGFGLRLPPWFKGAGLAAFVLLSIVAERPLLVPDFDSLIPPMGARAALNEQLQALPGRHLVLVHYGPKHDVMASWIYNRANVDASKVVWARDLSPAGNRELLKYYRDRRLWYVEADAPSPRLNAAQPEQRAPEEDGKRASVWR
jgi:hypothetical protein